MIADLGIDLGTSSILVYAKKKGVILKEPAIVAYDRDRNQIRGIGEEARQMIQRASGNVVPVLPIRHGMISDYGMTEKILVYLVRKALGKRVLKKPIVSICIPSDITEVEKKAIEEAAYSAGARKVTLVEGPMAAAIGAGIDISKPSGTMVVDIGGGTTDIAVISLGTKVASRCIKVGGSDFDESIIQYLKKKHNVLIGEKMAEHIKIQVGSVYPLIKEETMKVNGRDILGGGPKQVSVSSRELEEVFRDLVEEILQGVLEMLSLTPPELCADILERGILLTGGGSLLRGFEELLQEKTGVNTLQVEEPMQVVAVGTGRYEEIVESRRER